MGISKLRGQFLEVPGIRSSVFGLISSPAVLEALTCPPRNQEASVCFSWEPGVGRLTSHFASATSGMHRKVQLVSEN